MTDPIEGNLATLYLRVTNRARAAAYFGGLFSWTFAQESGGDLDWSHTAAGIVDRPWALAITEDASAPRVRLGFEVADPEEALARAKSLGGAGGAPEASFDDQGLPLAFLARSPRPPANDHATGDLGVAVALVGDTVKARTFQEALFGDGFHQIGPQDRWWSSRSAFGVFSNTLGFYSNDPVASPEGDGAPNVQIFVCVRDLAEHKRRVGELGGIVLAESAMGPYQVCACRDDQGTSFNLWRDPAR
jgi:predicted enzyme related to lactoylglutathione lyase